MSCVHKKGTSQRPQRQFACRHCDRVFQNYDNLFRHVTENHPFNQQEGGRSAPNPRSLYENQTAENGQQRLSLANDVNNELDNNAEKHQQPLEETAIGNGVVNKYLMPTGNEKYDVSAFFANVRGQIQSFLQYRVLTIGGIKWNLCVQVKLRRDDAEGDANTSPYFRSQTYMTLSAEDFAEHDLNEAMQKMYASLEQFMLEGSGWYVNKVLKLEIHTVTYKLIRASTYLPLPKSLALSRSLLNIENEDNECFLYCLLASLYPVAKEPERPMHYVRYEKEVNMTGVTYPITLPQIRRIENLNSMSLHMKITKFFH